MEPATLIWGSWTESQHDPTCHGTVISVVMVQWFCSISETQIDIWNIISPDFEMVWHNNSPQYSMTYMSWVQWFLSSWSSDFVLYLKAPFDIWTSYLQIMKCNDTVFDLNINIGHYGLYFMVPVILLYIWKIIWYMHIIFPDYEMVWHNLWPQYDSKSPWPIFHGPVILLEGKHLVFH